MKAYDIMVNEADDSAEINLYGEVVSQRPTDWDGNAIEGLYVVLEDFLKDIDNLKGKSNVSFHINSTGGDVFAGIAIYNRMKQFAGKVITIVDGLAASAASIIAQGATPGHRKVCNGALTMIHGASTLLWGYYNAGEVKGVLKRVNAVDKSLAEIYASCTGTEEDQIRAMMSATTWMTSQEAIENGFADEIVDTGEQVTMSLNGNRSLLTVNGIAMSAKGLFNLPDYIQVTDKVTTGNIPDVIKNKNAGGMRKSMTVEELKAEYPELCAQIKADAAEEVKGEQQTAVDEAVKAEVTRMKEIDEIAGKIADKQLVTDAKYGEKKMNAGELALEALKRQEDVGKEFLQNLHKDNLDSKVGGVIPTPNQGNLSAKEQSKKDIADGAALIAGIAKGE